MKKIFILTNTETGSELSRLSQTLDFSLDNHEQINDLFEKWRSGKDQNDFQTIQVWVYYWTRRYFLRKLISAQITSPGDTEQLIELAYSKFLSHHHTVKEPGRFASWISIICKNKMLDYFRTAQSKLEYYEDNNDLYQTDMIAYDFAEELMKDIEGNDLMDRFLERISGRIQPDCQIVLTKRLKENKSYPEIAAELNISTDKARKLFHMGMISARNSNEINEIINTKSFY